MQNLTDNLYVLLILGMTGASLLVVLFILLQVRGRNQLLRREKQLQEMETAHQRALLHAALLSQETERSRIGMDLHDEVGTVLSSLRLTLEELPDAVLVPRTQAKNLIDQVMRSVRDIAHDLSPFRSPAYVLTDALEDLCDRVNHSAHPRFTLHLADDGTAGSLRHLSPTVTLSLYRVIAELTQNTIKHADAHNITLTIGTRPEAVACPDTLAIDYRDDGRGMPSAPDKPGMGMRNIESRLGLIGAGYTFGPPAGQPEAGFSLLITLPLQKQPNV